MCKQVNALINHIFSYEGKFYLINSPIRTSIAKQKIEIRRSHDSEIVAYFAGRQLDIAEVIEPTKNTPYDFEIQKKLDVIELAEKLGNVTEAARISRCSRQTIYENRRRLKKGGPQALKRQFNPDKHHKNRTAKTLEDVIIDFSIENPHLG